MKDINIIGDKTSKYVYSVMFQRGGISQEIMVRADSGIHAMNVALKNGYIPRNVKHLRN